MLDSLRRPLEAVVYHEDRRLARCHIRRGRYIIGHEKKNEIVLDEASISGRHARLNVVSEEEIFLEDLGSANGTFVQGVQVQGLTRVALDAEVQLGATTLFFQRSGLPAVVFQHLPAGFLRAQRYQMGEVLSQDRTSVLHAARDASLDRDVAVRTMQPSSQRSAAAVLRFVREAQIGGQLQHSGILPVYELGLDDRNQLFFTTRIGEGETLAGALLRLKAGGAPGAGDLRLADLLAAWQRVCGTMAYAHSRGVVHANLTPESVTLGGFGEVFVTGWGLSQLLPGDAVDPHRVRVAPLSARTPLSQFSAPEQAGETPDEADTRTDVHALGGLLYSVLTLRAPFEGETDEALQAAVLESKAPPFPAKGCAHWPGGRLPEATARVALKALSRAKEDRYSSVAEMLADFGG